MKTSTKTILTTTALALTAGTVTAMNGGTIIADDQIGTTGAVYIEFSGGSHCSGTLLAPTWVLTARHCLVPNAVGYGDDGVMFSSPAGYNAAANAATLVGNQVVLAGWTASRSTNDVKTRKATLLGLTLDGYRSAGFGNEGYVPIQAGDPSVITSELRDVVAIGSSDVVAVGTATTAAGSYMLVVRVDGAGNPVGTRWPVADAPVAGTATRALAVASGVIVAGTDLTGGVSRWRAVRFDLAGHRDATFAPFFGTNTGGAILDVVQVGSHLVWLGTYDGTSGRPVLVSTDLDGHIEGAVTAIDPAMVALPTRLLAHNDNAVWIAGTDASQTTACVARRAVPGFAATTGWPANGGAMTPAPNINAELVINGLGEDASGRVTVGGSWFLQEERHAMVGRFTADGTPDLSYAQSGVVITMNHDEQRAESVLIGTHPTAPILVIGRRDDEGKSQMWANAFDHRSDRADTLHVTYAGVSSDVKTVLLHPDPSVDIGLVELKDPIADASRVVAVTGIDHAPSSDLEGEDITCLGYGLHEGDVTGQLRSGQVTVNTADGAVIDGFTFVPTIIRGGDSGGGCVTGSDGGVVIAGVISRSTESPTALEGLGVSISTVRLIDAARFVDFVEDKVPGLGGS